MHTSVFDKSEVTQEEEEEEWRWFATDSEREREEDKQNCANSVQNGLESLMTDESTKKQFTSNH